MRIVFVNRYFWPDHSATAQMLSDVAFDLSTRGFNVHVVCSRQRYDDAAADLPEAEEASGVSIWRVGSTRFGRQHLLGRLLDYFGFLWSAIWCLRRHLRRDDVVVMKTDPPLLGVVLQPFLPRGVRRVHWWQDVYPEVATELGVARSRGWLDRCLRRWRRQCLAAADAVVVVGDTMRQRVEQAGAPAARLRVIGNFADTEALAPVPHDQNPLREAFNLAHRFVVGYSGNFGRAHDFDGLLSALALLPAESPVLLLLIGGGAQASKLRLEVARLGLGERVRFLPYQARERLAWSLSCIDLHVVSLLPQLEGLIVPSKVYGALAVGRPVLFLGDVQGEVARLLARFEAGVSCANQDSAAIAAAISHYAQDPVCWQRHAEQARIAAEAVGSRRGALEAWVDLIESLPQR